MFNSQAGDAVARDRVTRSSLARTGRASRTQDGGRSVEAVIATETEVIIIKHEWRFQLGTAARSSWSLLFALLAHISVGALGADVVAEALVERDHGIAYDIEVIVQCVVDVQAQLLQLAAGREVILALLQRTGTPPAIVRRAVQRVSVEA